MTGFETAVWFGSERFFCGADSFWHRCKIRGSFAELNWNQHEPFNGTVAELQMYLVSFIKESALTTRGAKFEPKFQLEEKIEKL